jgi:hypothetical protein
MQPIKTESSKTAELERLRRELLRRIIASEARRQATREIPVAMRSPKA